ncbi:MAG TPA: RES family NAD+ phosphorylase [Burkholderiales bacterium]
MYEDLIGEVEDFHGDLVRNIQTIRVSQDLFDDLSDDPAERAVAVAAEGVARIASAAPLITRPFDYGSVVTYPFVEWNGHATRFSDGLAYGVWYGSLELETTVYETVHHRHRFLADAFPGEDRAIANERRVFEVRCDAILIDLRGRERKEKRLVDRSSYAFTQPLGRYLHDQGQNGLLVRSARDIRPKGGVNAALFRAEALANVRDLCHLTYLMNPTKDSARVERTPGRLWMEIRPSRLA